jgi:iron complex outermembrane receptor protein
VGGFRGKFPNGWNWDASYQYGGSNTQSHFGNNINVAHLINALDPTLCAAAPGCVVLNPFGPTSVTPPMANYIRVNDEVDNHYREQIAQVIVNGDLLTLPAGPLAFSLGAEYRDEEGGTTYDPVILAGDSGLTNAVNTHGDYNTKDVFGELHVPLLKDAALAKALDLNLAARYSDYSTFGGHSTWKVGVNWSITDDVRLRANVGTAFRAPDINEAFGGFLNTFASYADPCDVVTGLRANPAINAGCTAAGLSPTFRQITPKTNAGTGGNSHLQPETADEYTIGLILQPSWLSGFSATIDYYNIKLDHTIGGPAISTTLTNCYLAFSASNPDCARVTRGLGGQITQLDLSRENLGAIRTEGIDFGVDYVWDAEKLGLDEGRFLARLLGTYVLGYKQQTAPNGAFVQAAGNFSPNGAFGAVTRLRMTGTFGYSRSDWDFTWIVRYIQGLDAVNANPATSPPQYLTVPDVFYHDISVSYRHDRFKVTGGIENLFDKQPPFVLLPSSNFDSTIYDVIGRYFFARLTWKY